MRQADVVLRVGGVLVTEKQVETGAATYALKSIRELRVDSVRSRLASIGKLCAQWAVILYCVVLFTQFGASDTTVLVMGAMGSILLVSLILGILLWIIGSLTEVATLTATTDYGDAILYRGKKTIADQLRLAIVSALPHESTSSDLPSTAADPSSVRSTPTEASTRESRASG